MMVEAPTAMMRERAKSVLMNGMEMLMAAMANSETPRATNIPSTMV